MDEALQVGRILRADTVGYTVGAMAMDERLPHVGNFVITRGQQWDAIGVIEQVRIEDDPFVRQLIAANVSTEYIMDQRQRRQVPIEVSVVHVGLKRDGVYLQRRPTQPPAVLEEIYTFEGYELAAFGGEPPRYTMDYLGLLLDGFAGRPDGDEVIASAVQTMVKQYPEGDRRGYALAAGQALARRLSVDLLRLDNLLRRIRPQ